jgi:outer membrane lipoprotein-sorting protein
MNRLTNSFVVQRVLALALGWALALAGCASIPPARPSVSPEAVTARTRLMERWQEFQDLRTLADVRIKRGNKTQRVTGVLLLKAPSSLRFEALSPFGTPVYVVSGDGKSLIVWEVLDQRAYILPASREASRRWLGVDVNANDLVAALAGRAVPLDHARETALLPPDDLGPSLSLRGDDGTQRIWFSPDTGAPRAIEWSGGSNPARAVFADGGAGSPPAGVTVATLDGKLEVQVKYREPRMNTGFDPDLLRLTVPEHVKIQDFR